MRHPRSEAHHPMCGHHHRARWNPTSDGPRAGRRMRSVAIRRMAGLAAAALGPGRRARSSGAAPLACWRLATSGGSGELDAVGVSELLEDVLKVGGDGAPGYDELTSNLAVREPLRHEWHDETFCRREAVPSERRSPRSGTSAGTPV